MKAMTTKKFGNLFYNDGSCRNTEKREDIKYVQKFKVKILNTQTDGKFSI